MKVYLDTSVVLRFLLNQGPILKAWGRWDVGYISEIGGLEARRTFDRLRLMGILDDEGVVAAHEELERFESSISTIDMTRRVLQRASMPMPTVVKTLDAVHLATAMLAREHEESTILFATHDDKQAAAARALGFTVLAT